MQIAISSDLAKHLKWIAEFQRSYSLSFDKVFAITHSLLYVRDNLRRYNETIYVDILRYKVAL